MVIALVALFLVAILTVLAIFLNVGQSLVIRERLETMAEFGAAAGGRIVAEAIATRAGQNVTSAPPVFPPPRTDEERTHPEWFLTPADRTEFQTDPQFILSVEQAVKDFIIKNALGNLGAIDVNDPASVQITYPVSVNDCSGSSKKVDVHVVIHYTIPFLAERLSTLISGASGITLSPESTYSVTICH